MRLLSEEFTSVFYENPTTLGLPKAFYMLVVLNSFVFCKNNGIFFTRRCDDNLVTWITMKRLWENCRTISNTWG